MGSEGGWLCWVWVVVRFSKRLRLARLRCGAHVPKLSLERHARRLGVVSRNGGNDPVTHWLLQIARRLPHHLCDRANLDQTLDNIGKSKPATKH